jgi:hypothetical protein
LNRNTVNRYLTLIRERITEHCETQSPFKGEIEVDESYFGGKRIKGKRGRGAYKKTPVFGILKRGGKVYTEVVPDWAKATLQGIKMFPAKASVLFITSKTDSFFGKPIYWATTWITLALVCRTLVSIADRMNWLRRIR